ncbi:MAG: phosphoribosylformylglycinamidine synthase subunit PurQ [Deltaproteobacteria bacterium]|nr:phosphoribosylformylglycinamidine synthase subunit PurQ [Deltaproteobacteria bacterium]
MQSTVNALVPTGFGINCEAETRYALQRAGAEVETPHLNDLIDDGARLARTRILVLAGGFAFGDHLGAGRALANRLRARLGDALGRFVADGGLVLGICNGFQTMARLGLLPSGRVGKQQISLTTNRHSTFYDGWVKLRFDPQSPCVFTRGIEQLDLPVRHGEGRLLPAASVEQQILDQRLGVCRYVDQAGEPSERFPDNPNGSWQQLAGICDPSGRLFGLMPHPEAYLYPENHPHWRREPGVSRPTGQLLFVNAVEACRRG